MNIVNGVDFHFDFRLEALCKRRHSCLWLCCSRLRANRHAKHATALGTQTVATVPMVKLLKALFIRPTTWRFSVT